MIDVLIYLCLCAICSMFSLTDALLVFSLFSVSHRISVHSALRMDSIDSCIRCHFPLGLHSDLLLLHGSLGSSVRTTIARVLQRGNVRLLMKTTMLHQQQPISIRLQHTAHTKNLRPLLVSPPSLLLLVDVDLNLEFACSLS